MNEEIKNTLKCLRALDGILLGILLLIPLILLQNLLSIIPSVLIKYFFIVPVFIIFISSFKIPYDYHNRKDWKNVLRRIRFFITGSLALSPFWAWWNQAVDNSYLLINILILLLFAMLYIYNLVTLSLVSAIANEWKRFANLAKLTRLAIMYITIAPLFSFLVTVCFVKNTCWEIIIFIFQNQRLILPFLIIPLLMSIFLILQWRKKLSEM